MVIVKMTWEEQRGAWRLWWGSGANTKSFRVRAADLNGDRDAAETVAKRVKERISALEDSQDAGEHIAFLNECIAEQLQLMASEPHAQPRVVLPAGSIAVLPQGTAGAKPKRLASQAQVVVGAEMRTCEIEEVRAKTVGDAVTDEKRQDRRTCLEDIIQRDDEAVAARAHLSSGTAMQQNEHRDAEAPSQGLHIESAAARGAWETFGASGEPLSLEDDLQGVLTIQPYWAALIFAGLKTDEVRSAPVKIRGNIGVAISEAPGLIVGKVRIQDCLGLMRSAIAKRQQQTRLSPEALKELIGARGYVYCLSDPILFDEPIPHVTNGQHWKGVPNEHEQMLVRKATIRRTGSSESDVAALMQLFKDYKQRQALPEHRESRELSKRLTLWKGSYANKRPASWVALQKMVHTAKKPKMNPSIASGASASDSEASASAAHDFAATVDTIASLREMSGSKP